MLGINYLLNMRVDLIKFGNILISRQAGKEALAAFQPSLKSISPDENLEINFSEVITFSPSWGDEFLTPLQNQFKDRLTLTNISDNPSIIESLKIIEQTSHLPFKIA